MFETTKKSIKSRILSILVVLIKGYQKTLSPDHSWLGSVFPRLGCCYYPSCSEYARESLEKYGVGKGLILISKRLIRCHPLSSGGHDPVR